ncbi:hypothetical protein GCM10027360_32720 [Amycolatopsis echigonensis]
MMREQMQVAGLFQQGECLSGAAVSDLANQSAECAEDVAGPVDPFRGDAFGKASAVPLGDTARRRDGRCRGLATGGNRVLEPARGRRSGSFWSSR